MDQNGICHKVRYEPSTNVKVGIQNTSRRGRCPAGQWGIDLDEGDEAVVGVGRQVGLDRRAMFGIRSSVIPKSALGEHMFDEAVPVRDGATCMYDLVAQVSDQLDV